MRARVGWGKVLAGRIEEAPPAEADGAALNRATGSGLAALSLEAGVERLVNPRHRLGEVGLRIGVE